MNLSKNAIGNLINRYKAVLKKCHLLNTFGSLAVAGMLVAGSLGVGVVGGGVVGDAHAAASLDTANVDTDGAGTEWAGGTAPALTLEIGSITSGDSTVGANANLTIFGDGSTTSGQVSAGDIAVNGGILTIGGSSSPENTNFGGILSTSNDGIINITNTKLTHANNLDITGGALNIAANASLTSGELTADNSSKVDIKGYYKTTGDFNAKTNTIVFVRGDGSLLGGNITVGSAGVFEIDGTFTGGEIGGDGAENNYVINIDDGGTIKAKNMVLNDDTILSGGNITIDTSNDVAITTGGHDLTVNSASSTLSLTTTGAGTVTTAALNASGGTINITSGGAVTTAGLLAYYGVTNSTGTINIEGASLDNTAHALTAGNGGAINITTTGAAQLGTDVSIANGSVSLKGATNATLGGDLSITGNGSFTVESTAQVNSDGFDIDLGAAGNLTVASTSLGFDITGAELTSKVENFGVLDQTAWTMTNAGTVAKDLTGGVGTTVLLTTNLAGGGKLLSDSVYETLIKSAEKAVFGTETGAVNITIAGVSQDRTLTTISTLGAPVVEPNGVVGAGTFGRNDSNTFAGIVATIDGATVDSTISGTGTLNLTGNGGIALSEGDIDVTVGTLNLGYDATAKEGAGAATGGGTLNGNLVVNGTGGVVKVHGTQGVTVTGSTTVSAGSLEVVTNGRFTAGTVTVGDGSDTATFTTGETHVETLNIGAQGTTVINNSDFKAKTVTVGATSGAAALKVTSSNTYNTTHTKGIDSLIINSGAVIDIDDGGSGKTLTVNTATINETEVDLNFDNTNPSGTLAANSMIFSGNTTIKDGTIQAKTMSTGDKNITLDGGNLTLTHGGAWDATADISVSTAGSTLDIGGTGSASLDMTGETLTFTAGTVDLRGSSLILDYANAGTATAAGDFTLDADITTAFTTNGDSIITINGMDTFFTSPIAENIFIDLKNNIRTTLTSNIGGEFLILNGIIVTADTLSGVNSDYSIGKDTIALGAGDLTYNLHDTVISHISGAGAAAESNVKNGTSLTLTGKGLTGGSTLLSGKDIIVSEESSLTLGAEGGAATSTFTGNITANGDSVINVVNTDLTQSGDVVLNDGLLHVASGAKLTSTGTLNFTTVNSRMDIAGEYKFTGDFNAANTSFVADLSATPSSGQIAVDGTLNIDGALNSVSGTLKHTGTIKATNIITTGDTRLNGGNIEVTSGNTAITLANDFIAENANSTLTLNAGTAEVNTSSLQAGTFDNNGGNIDVDGGAITFTANSTLITRGSGSIDIKGTSIAGDVAINVGNDSNGVSIETTGAAAIGEVEIDKSSVSLKGATNATLDGDLSISGNGSFNVQGTAQVDSNGFDIDLGAAGNLTVAGTSAGFDITGADLTSKVENFGVLDQTAWTMSDAGTVGIDLTGGASATVFLTTTLAGGGQLLTAADYTALIKSAEKAIFGTETGAVDITIAGISQDRTLTSISTGAGAVQVNDLHGVIGGGTFSRSDANTVAGIVAPLTPGGSADSIINDTNGTGSLNLTGNNNIALSVGDITVTKGILNLGYDDATKTQGGTLQGILTVNGAGGVTNIYGDNVIIKDVVNIESGALNVVSGGELTTHQNVTVGGTGSVGADFNVNSDTIIHSDLIVSDKGTVTVTESLTAANVSLGGLNATNTAVFNNNAAAFTKIAGTTTVNAFGELNVTDGTLSTANLVVAHDASAKVHIAAGETLRVSKTAEFKHDSVDVDAGTLSAPTLRLSHAGTTTLTGGIFNVYTIDSEHDIILNDADGVATGTQLNFTSNFTEETWVSSSDLTVSKGQMLVGSNATLDFASNDKSLSVATGSSLDFTGGTVILDLDNVGTLSENGGVVGFTEFMAADKKLNGTLNASLAESFLNIDASDTHLAVTQDEYADMIADAKTALGFDGNFANIRFTGLSLDGTVDDLDYVFTDLGTDYVNKQLQAGTLVHQGNTIIAGIKADGTTLDSTVRGQDVKLTLTGMDAADGTKQDVLSQGNVNVEYGGELVLGYANADGSVKSPEQLYFDGDIDIIEGNTLTVEYSNVIMGEKTATPTVSHSVILDGSPLINVNNGGTLQTNLDNSRGAGLIFVGTVGNSTSTLKIMHDIIFLEANIFDPNGNYRIGRHGVLDVAGTVTIDPRSFEPFNPIQMSDGAMLVANAFVFNFGTNAVSLMGGNIKVDHNADTTLEGRLTVNNANSNVIFHVTDGIAGNETVTTDSALSVQSGTLDVQAGTLHMGGALHFGAGGTLKVAGGAAVDLTGNAFVANLANFGTFAYDATAHSATFTELTSKLVQENLMGDAATSVLLNATEATGLLLDASAYSALIESVGEALFGSGSAVNDITIAGVSAHRTLTSVSDAGTAINDAYGVVGAGTYSLDGTSTFAGIVEDYVTLEKDSIIDGSASTVLNLSGYNGGLFSEGRVSVNLGSLNLGYDGINKTNGGTVHGDLIVGDSSATADAKVTSYGTNVIINGNVHVHSDGILQVAAGSFSVQGASGIDLDGLMHVEAGASVYADALSFDNAASLKILNGNIYINNTVALPMSVIDLDADAAVSGGGLLRAQSFDFIADTTINDGHLAITGEMSTDKKLTLDAMGHDATTAFVATSVDAQFSVSGGKYIAEKTATTSADVTVTKGTLNLSGGAVMDVQHVNFTALGLDARLNIGDGTELIVDHKVIGIAEDLSTISTGPTVSYEAGNDDVKGTVSIMGLHAKSIDMSTYTGAGTVAEYDALHNAGYAAFGNGGRIDYGNITLTNTHTLGLHTVAANNMTGLGSSVVNVGSGEITAGQVVNVGYVAQSTPPKDIRNEGTLYINGGPLADDSPSPEYLFVGDIITDSASGRTSLGNLETDSKFKGNLEISAGEQTIMNVAVEGNIEHTGGTTNLMGNSSANTINATVNGKVNISAGTITATEVNISDSFDLNNVDLNIDAHGTLKAAVMNIGTTQVVNIGSNVVGGQGSVITNKADFNATTALGDPAWSNNAALNVIGAASSLIVQEFYDASDATGTDDRINGRLIAGQNAYMLFGTTDTSLPLQVFNNANSGLVWGNGVDDISAALFLTKAQTLNATTGGVLVDGNVVADAGGVPTDRVTSALVGVATDTAEFASNSLLVIDAGASGVGSNGTAALSGDTSATVGTNSTLNVAANAKLHIVGGKGGELIVADSFELGSILTSGGQTGWSGDNISFSSQTMDVDTTKLTAGYDFTNGFKVHVDASVANTTYGKLFQGGAASYLNTQLLNGIGLDVGAGAPAGRRFLSIALTEGLGFNMGETDGKRTVTTIEGAAQMAAVADVAKAAISSNWAAQGAVQDRNSYGGFNAMNSGEGSGSMTLNKGEVSVQTGENGGNMADKAGVGVWLTPLYKWNMGSGFEGGSLEHDYDMGLGGIAIGADFTNRIDHETAFRIGLAFNVGAGYSDSTGDFNETNNDFSFWGLNLYGAFQKENFVATLDFGFTSTANELDQDLPLTMGMGNLEADVDAFAFSAGLNLEYTFNAGMMDITPHAGIRFMSVTTEKYDIDSSAGRIASVDEDTQNVWYFPIGVTFSADIESESGWKFTPKLDLGILAAAGDLDATSNAQFTGVPGSMELNMDNVDGFAFNGGLGFELSNEESGISIGLNYNLTAGEKDTSHMIFANFRYDF